MAFKDASELHVAGPELFKDRFTDALKNATPWAELERLETVEKLARLYSEDEESVTIVKLAEEPELDKSSAWRRVRAAIDRGYVKNLEDRRGRPARLVLGDRLPDDLEVLPTVERLHGCR